MVFSTVKSGSTKAMLITAIKQDGRFLQHASDDMKADRELVLLAVRQNGTALKYASDALKADSFVVTE